MSNALRDALDIFHVSITNVECTSHTSLYTNTYLIIQILIILKFLGHCTSRMGSAKPGLTSASQIIKRLNDKSLSKLGVSLREES